MTKLPAEARTDPTIEAAASYQRWREDLRNSPGYGEVFEEEAARGDLWLQLAEARKSAGLSRADLARRLGVSAERVARMERRGYDGYTLSTLRRYIRALGSDFVLDVTIRRPDHISSGDTASA
jgi:ribosome-binding protein aMBF1 (putative translation factor)